MKSFLLNYLYFSDSLLELLSFIGAFRSRSASYLQVKGHDCTIGFAKFLRRAMKNECTLVHYLRSQGAIPFVITTVPQGLLSFACCSSLYGTTCNPHAHSRTPGGSSGGRLMVRYAQNGIPGKNRLALSYGFFTRTVDEQMFLLNNVIGSKEYHQLVPQALPYPLDKRKYTHASSRSLRIGYFIDDGFMKPVPA
ncbi:unnamed protein product [Gongylonema pulchrum]|uniref:Amidase domain-containing protein n=1 Tax=Gongylonema pulchrum TaxID=637853 RepID=A0A183E974_9BILA|nr:unnamed protein product [Gongylonema pulchrum]